MKLAELIAKLSKKAGVDVNGEDFKKISIPDVDVPDEVATAIDTKLMNEQAAISYPSIKNKIKAEALNGIDALVNSIIEEDQLQGTDDIKNAESSFERVKKLYGFQKNHFNQKLKDAVKPGSKDGADKDTYEKQIAELNKAIADLKKTQSEKEAEFNNTRESDLTNFEIQKILLGKDYALPKEMDADLKIQTANAAIAKQLQAQGFKIIRHPETKQLSVVKTDGTPAYNQANEPVELTSLIDGALAQNKLLKVNDGAGGEGQQQQPVIVPGTEKGNASIVAQIDAELFK
jgi:hypothetical protein